MLSSDSARTSRATARSARAPAPPAASPHKHGGRGRYLATCTTEAACLLWAESHGLTYAQTASLCGLGSGQQRARKVFAAVGAAVAAVQREEQVERLGNGELCGDTEADGTRYHTERTASQSKHHRILVAVKRPPKTQNAVERPRPDDPPSRLWAAWFLAPCVVPAGRSYKPETKADVDATTLAQDLRPGGGDPGVDATATVLLTDGALGFRDALLPWKTTNSTGKADGPAKAPGTKATGVAHVSVNHTAGQYTRNAKIVWTGGGDRKIQVGTQKVESSHRAVKAHLRRYTNIRRGEEFADEGGPQLRKLQNRVRRAAFAYQRPRRDKFATTAHALRRWAAQT